MLKRLRHHDSGKGAPGAEFGIAKQDLAPSVKRHLDNLQAQVAAILDKYGVASFEELKALGEEDLDKLTVLDISKLLELAGVIKKIIETGEIEEVDGAGDVF